MPEIQWDESGHKEVTWNQDSPMGTNTIW